MKRAYPWALLALLIIATHSGGPAPAHAAPEPERPIMAFYYPWWEFSDWSYSRMSDLPLIRYSGGDEATLRRHVQQADDAGIDALICTWYGPDEDRLNGRCRRLIELAREDGRDLRVALIPDQSAWSALRSVERLERALDVMKRDFFNQPNYLRYRGRPVVFWFNPPSLGDIGVWRELRNRADAGREQFWFGGTDNFAYLEVYDALYYFDISWERRPGAAMASYAQRLEQWNRANGQSRPFIATVMPGYDDLRFRGGHARDRQNGDYYRGTWQTAIERNAQAVVLTSFNEFYEGSHIEPSERYGDLYLQLTRELSDRFRREVGQSVPRPTPCQSFPETGQQVCGRILEYWRANGGQAIFGLPIGPQRSIIIEGRERQVQEFERYRLELHPENRRPYDVLLGRLGVEVLALQGRDWQQFPKAQDVPRNCLSFIDTGHNLCEPFVYFFLANGVETDGRPGYSLVESIALFGMPLSEPQTEVIEGRPRTVQWFERARFEWHPENPDPYKVLLGRLGAEMMEMRRTVGSLP